MTPASELRCAVHPDAVAVGPCARCGTFMCAACVSDERAGQCAACVARTGRAGLPPLWERRREAGVSLPAAFLRTLVEVLTAPGRLFAQVDFGRTYSAPLGFAVLTGVLGAAVNFGVRLAYTGPPVGDALSQEWPRAALRLGALPLRLTLLPAALALGSLVAGLRTDSFRRAFRVYAYLEAAAVPIALLTGGVATLGSFLALAVYGSIGLAAVHGAKLRRGIAAMALVLVPLPCLFVAFYQFSSAR